MKPGTLKKLFVIGTQHLDVAWLWNRIGHGEELQKMVFELALHLIRGNPDSRFIMSRSTAWGFAVVEKKWPHLFAEVQKAVENGSIELAGGQWVEPDNLIPSGESFLRQGLYGQHYFLSRFGKTASVVWNPDVFGHGNTLPQLFRETGLAGYYFHRMIPKDNQGNPIQQFVWEGPNGSQVMCFAGNWRGRPDLEVAHEIFETSSRAGLPADYIVTGMRSDRRMTIRDGWLDLPAQIGDECNLEHCRWSSAAEVVGEMETYRDSLPVVRGDLGGYMFTGTYTSDQITKRFNRRLENDLAAAEAVSTWAFLVNTEYPASRLRQAWQNVCLNQFHDIICGTCYASAQEEAHELYRNIDTETREVIRQSFSALAERVSTTDQPGVPVVVFNPTSVVRSDLITMNFVDRKPRTVVSRNGEAVRTQQQKVGDGSSLMFCPENLQGYCADVYYIQTADLYSEVQDDELVLENEFVRVVFDPSYGTMQSLYDKRQQYECVPVRGEANRIVIYDDSNDYEYSPDHRWDPWYIKTSDRVYDPHGAYSVYVAESGAIRKTIRIERSLQVSPGYGETSIVQEISLYHHSPMIHVHMFGDWSAQEACVRAEFDLPAGTDTVVCDMAYGVIERDSDFSVDTSIGHEGAEDRVAEGASREEPDRPMQMWIDVSDGKHGLALINNGKYGYHSHDGLVGITLMRAPQIRDGEVAGLGPFEFSYAIYPHGGSWKEAGVSARAMAFNRPLMHSLGFRHEGSIEPGSSLFRVSDPSVLITAVKKAELTSGIVLRLYQSSGGATAVDLTSLYPMKDLRVVDALERDKKADRLSQTSPQLAHLELGGFEVMSILIDF